MDGTVTALADNCMMVLGDFSQNYVVANRIRLTVEPIQTLFHRPRIDLADSAVCLAMPEPARRV